MRPFTPNAAIYFYPNKQQSTTLWFHDHTLGITRLNVLSGLAAFYFIRDQFDTGLASNPLALPAGAQEIELMIQDRQFDTNGQLLFPDSNNNPSPVDGPPSSPQIHPFWIPEFFGDTMCVNGRTWPFLAVQPRRYRFRVVNACKWNGKRDGGSFSPIPGSVQDQSGQGIWMTELPRIGSPEVWEFLNTTVDAHPIHIHLIQFQLLNRQPVVIDPDTGQPTYLDAWANAFPGGTFNGETADGSWGRWSTSRARSSPATGRPETTSPPTPTARWAATPPSARS
ncbi:MAG TPA: multicopper oxidase domain-containing protein [Streptosporangiaceae bacterium]